jgi:hypothetical protein
VVGRWKAHTELFLGIKRVFEYGGEKWKIDERGLGEVEEIAEEERREVEGKRSSGS